jgi:micrococcal nuclease
MEPSYIYKAVVKSIYDGDTLRVDIDCGFNVWQHDVSLRLKGINAPELRGEQRAQGIVSRDWLQQAIPVGSKILIKTDRDAQEKYGRWLATVYYNNVNLNEEMVRLGYAVPFM